MQRFREDATCEPTPRGGSTSPLEEYAQQILALNRDRPDLTLDEIVLALHKRGIPGSRSALSRFFARHGIAFKKACAPQNAATRCRRSPYGHRTIAPRGSIELNGVAVEHVS